ncbi:MAG: glutathione S-transferase family protein [Proteobacteria bacterium]|nr:glutathione S-transferase family protein [Pseudomonadota bacterium]
MFKLYGFGPTRSLRAKWALQEAGQKFEEINGRPLTGSEEYKKIHPQGKLPAIVHNDAIIFESVAIVNYVGSLDPAKNFVPKDGSVLRAKYDQWSCYALAEMEAWLWSNAKHSFLYPEKDRIPAVIEANSKEFILSAGVIEQVLKDQNYILGKDFTFADINVGYTLNWGRCFGLTGHFPNINAYLDRLAARSASPLHEQTDFFASVNK